MLKNKIYRYFFIEISKTFITILFAFTAVAWTVRAVNFLDFVSEDGHSFGVYFMYTLLNFPKIFARLILFMFFISVFYTIIKYEEKMN